METIISEYNSINTAEEQFLTFELSGEEYGIPILRVQEIRVWDKLTIIPNSPPYIKGVLNLRGTIVPIINLRLRFGIPEAEYTSSTVIVVVNIGGRLAGLVVDSVDDVVAVDAKQRCETPTYEGQMSRQFIQGLAQINGRLLILLDVEKLVKNELLQSVIEDKAG